MGCDGGTIPKRDELVKTKKKKTQYSKDIKNGAKWNYCHLSQLPLQKPIVADLLGFLYNKDCLIEYLLDKSKYESGPDHVKTLKDVKELNLMANPSFESNKQEAGDECSAINKSQWICAITGLEMNGTFKFYYLYSCGCVFSERAFKTIKSSNLKCLKCDKNFSDIDLIILNPTDEKDLEANETKIKLRKELIAKAKAERSSSSKESKKEEVKNVQPTTSKKANETTEISKKRSIESSIKHIEDDTSKLSTPLSSNKKMKTIQDDPNASQVYKSLFTTCDKAKNQQKAHWVTYNPQFF